MRKLLLLLFIPALLVTCQTKDEFISETRDIIEASTDTTGTFSFDNYHCYEKIYNDGKKDYCFDMDENGAVNSIDLLIVNELWNLDDYNMTDQLIFLGDYGTADTCNLSNPYFNEYDFYEPASSGTLFFYPNGSMGILSYTAEDEFESPYDCDLACLNSFKFVYINKNTSETYYFK